MKQFGLSLLLLASLSHAQESGDFKPAVTKPGADYYAIQAVPHGQVREVWYDCPPSRWSSSP